MLEKQEPKYAIGYNENDCPKIINRMTGDVIPDDEPIMIFRAIVLVDLEYYIDDFPEMVSSDDRESNLPAASSEGAKKWLRSLRTGYPRSTEARCRFGTGRSASRSTSCRT